MKPRSHRSIILLVLAVLLAAVTMGNISICDLVEDLSPTEATDTLRVALEAGESENVAVLTVDNNARFSLCPPSQVNGVYTKTSRFLSSGTTLIDLETLPTTPAGHYFLRYKKILNPCLGAPFPCSNLTTGWLELTVTNSTLAACFTVNAEIILANHPVTFSPFCSTGNIVLYEWWFNYNGNPSSPPSESYETFTNVETTFSAGEHTVRLVVHSQNGNEDEEIRVFTAVQP